MEVLECEWGCGADEARLEQVLKADTDKKIKAVAVVHNETTTGVTSDIGGVRQVPSPSFAAGCANEGCIWQSLSGFIFKQQP